MQINSMNSFNNFSNIWQLHNKKDRTAEENESYHNARKSNPILDAALYQSDVAEFYKDQGKAEEIAKKVARGEKISEEEKEFIKEYNPEILDEAEKAKQEAEKLEEQIKNASSKGQAMSMISGAMSGAMQMSKVNPLAGQLRVESISELMKKINDSDDDDMKNVKNAYNNNANKQYAYKSIDFTC